MTVRELLARMDSLELSEWVAFYSLEPWGDERADLRQAITSATLANIHRGKGQRAYKPEDFMPLQEPGPKQTPEEMTAALRQIVAGKHWTASPKAKME